MCGRRCLPTACLVSGAALAPFFGPPPRRLAKQIGFYAVRRCLQPARRLDGRRRERSWPAATLQLARALAARAAVLSSRPRSRPRWADAGPRAVGRRTTPTRSSSWSRGSLRGSPTPLVSPEAPPREPCPAEAVQRHLRRPRDRGGGAARTYITKRTYTNAPLQRELAAKKRPPAPRGAARPGQITARVTPSSRGQHIPRKQAAPAARLAVTAREAPEGGERRKRTRRPRARS